MVQKSQEHKKNPKQGKIQVIIAPTITKKFPWDLFDDASQGEPPIGGAGGIIYLSHHRKISFKFDLGHVTNNKVELLDLW